MSADKLAFERSVPDIAGNYGYPPRF